MTDDIKAPTWFDFVRVYLAKLIAVVGVAVVVVLALLLVVAALALIVAFAILCLLTLGPVIGIMYLSDTFLDPRLGEIGDKTWPFETAVAETSPPQVSVRGDD